MDIPNNLLIAQNVAKEAQMIAEAGQIGSMTVATSMAGMILDPLVYQNDHVIACLHGYFPYVHE
jgi:preprotein translocase subunit SecA